MKTIVLHIDRLVLRGVDRHDAAAVSGALQAELQRLLGADGTGTLATQASVHALQAGRVQLPQGADAPTLGHAVAARIAGAPGAAPQRNGGRP